MELEPFWSNLCRVPSGKRLQFAIEHGPVEIVKISLLKMVDLSIVFLLTFTRGYPHWIPIISHQITIISYQIPIKSPLFNLPAAQSIYVITCGPSPHPYPFPGLRARAHANQGLSCCFPLLSGMIFHQTKLLGGIPTPLKRMNSSVGILNFPI